MALQANTLHPLSYVTSGQEVNDDYCVRCTVTTHPVSHPVFDGGSQNYSSNHSKVNLPVLGEMNSLLWRIYLVGL